MTTDPTEFVRRRELAEQQQANNEAFAKYVTSTAFSLSLSRGMVQALATIDTAIANHHELMKVHVNQSYENALERRGLIAKRKDWGAYLDARLAARDRTAMPLTWDRQWEITRAGQLVLELLAEAQLVEPRALRHPLPPPPPGWTDPRPKLVHDGRHFKIAPSDREQGEPT